MFIVEWDWVGWIAIIRITTGKWIAVASNYQTVRATRCICDAIFHWNSSTRVSYTHFGTLNKKDKKKKNRFNLIKNNYHLQYCTVFRELHSLSDCLLHYWLDLSSLHSYSTLLTHFFLLQPVARLRSWAI